MEKDFLHKIDLKALERETNLSLEEIARMSGISDAKNLGKWSQDKDKGGSRPNFNALVRLLESGACTETLFGVEYRPRRNVKVLPSVEELIKTPRFQEELLKALNRMNEDGAK